MERLGVGRDFDPQNQELNVLHSVLARDGNVWWGGIVGAPRVGWMWWMRW